jgi:hypothetical protein
VATPAVPSDFEKGKFMASWLWSRKIKAPEPVAPVARLSPEELAEEIALQNIERAITALEAIKREYREMQAEFDLLLDTAGNIVHCSLGNAALRPVLEVRSRDLVRRHSTALETFNQRCREYAGVKGTNKNATSNRAAN